MKNLHYKNIQIFLERHRWSLAICLSSFVWCFAFRDFLLNKLNLVGDAVVYLEHLQFFVENMARGVYPFWEPSRNFGVPVEFFLRRIGEFNPFFFILILGKLAGIQYSSLHMLFLGFYFILGMIGFFLVSRRVLYDTRAAFIAYLFLMFSPLGTRLFDSFILFIFVPMVWFFYFLVAFTQQPKWHYFLGLIFCLMIAVTTYIPFYFLTIVLVFLICFVAVYFHSLKSILLRYFQFAITNKFFTCLCIAALMISLIPGILFHREMKRGEFVLPIRHTSQVGDTLEVEAQRFAEGGIMVLPATILRSTVPLKVAVSPKPESKLFSNLQNYRFGIFYVPIFLYLIFFMGMTTAVNKKIVLLILWGFLLYLIGLNDATPVYPFLFKYVFFFKYFRNFQFFLWVGILPIAMLALAEQFRNILEHAKTNQKQWPLMAGVIIIHCGLAVFLFRHANIISTSYWVVGISLVFFIFLFSRIFKNMPLHVGLNIVLPALLVLISIHPFEVFHHLSRTSVKHGAYRYDNFKGDNAYTNFPLPEYVEELSPESFSQRLELLSNKTMGSNYYAVKNRHMLTRKINESFLGRHIRSPLMVYNYVEPLDELRLGAMEKVAMTLARNKNIAFVSLDKFLFNKDKDFSKSMAEHPQVITKSSKEVQMVEYDINFLKLKTNFRTPKFLVYNDNYYSDWKVFVNGESADLHRTNVASKGVWVPAGENIVYFRFGEIWQYALKFFILGAFYFVFFVLCFLCIKNKRRNVDNHQIDIKTEGGEAGIKKRYSTFQVVKWFGSRVCVLYLVVFFTAYFLINHKAVERGIQGRILNTIMPKAPIKYLTASLNKKRNYFREYKKEVTRALADYAHYYEGIIKFKPLMSDAYGMSGFCSYHLGNPEKAISLYEKAIKINSKFFWFHYNLGLIYFEREEYFKAAKSFKSALSTKADDSLMFIRASRAVYLPIIKERVSTDGFSMVKDLRAGQQNGIQLLMLSEYYLKNYAKVLSMANSAKSINFKNKALVYYCVGASAYHLKDYKKAIFFLKKCLKLDSEHVEALKYFSLTLKVLGKEQDAARILQRSVILEKTKKSSLSIKEDFLLQPY